MKRGGFLWGFFLPVFQISGLIGFSKSENGVCILSKWRLGYCIAMLLLLTLFQLTFCFDPALEELPESLFALLSMLTESIGCRVAPLVGFFFLVKKNARICHATNRIASTVQKLNGLNTPKSGCLIEVHLTGFFVIQTLILVLHVVLGVTVNVEFYGTCMTVYLAFNYYVLLIDILVYVYVVNVYSMFSNLNAIFCQLLWKRKLRRLRSVGVLRDLYLKISEIAEEVNGLFGEAVLASTFAEFAMVVNTSFFHFHKDMTLRDLADYDYWILFYTFKFLKKLYIFSKTKNEVGTV